MKKHRIKTKEYSFIKKEEQIRLNRQNEFKQLTDSLMPDITKDSIVEAQKAVKLVKEMKKYGYDIFDAAVLSKGYVVTNQNDTHGKNRAWETFFGGRGDGKPTPDAPWGEIKLCQIVSEHKLEQVMTVGSLSKKDKETKERYVEDKFEDSSTYDKLKRCFITTYFQDGKQKGREISESFIFEVENEAWFSRIKEDWEHYKAEYLDQYSKYKSGEIKKKASGVMKSDTSGSRCPNGTLGIRSDAIIFTEQFFQEVSKHYAK